MIEEIISNKSEERMKLFEEAAGITRYKQRRKQIRPTTRTSTRAYRQLLLPILVVPQSLLH